MSLLQDLIRASQLARDRIILVRTAPNVNLPPGADVIDDFGPINIQRWWNLGIATAVRRGASVVAVANDDIVLAPGALQELAVLLDQTGASAASPGSSRKTWQRGWPFRRKLDGALWLLDVSSCIRPDERFNWAFGDDDLDVRFRFNGNGIATAPVHAVNFYHNQSSAQSGQLQQLTRRDRRTFWRLHPWVALSRIPLDMGRWIKSLVAHVSIYRRQGQR